ncbi:MAG: glycosyl hydrolase family 28-related protein [Thermogutta sp.]
MLKTSFSPQKSAPIFLLALCVGGGWVAADFPPQFRPIAYAEEAAAVPDVLQPPPPRESPALRPASKVRREDLGNRPLADLGFLDVTAAPFHADPTGRTDATDAIQAAVDFARENQLVCYFPTGDYLVSDTIVCEQYRALRPDGVSRIGDRNHPCVLMGDRSGARRPRWILAPRSRGFEDPRRPKPVVRFWAPGAGREAPIDQPQPNISMNQMFVGIDVVIGEGNPGATAIRHRGAQGSGVQDCTLDVRHGYCGLEGGCGSGGSHARVTILGGQIGLDLRETQPAPTITGFTLIGQQRAAVVCGSRQTAVLAGTIIRFAGSGPAIAAGDLKRGAHHGQTCIIDSVIEHESGSGKVGIWCGSGLYLRNVYFRGFASPIVQSGPAAAPLAIQVDGRHDMWRRIGEYAAGIAQTASAWNWNRRRYTYPSPIYLDGKKHDQPYLLISEEVSSPPADLQARHVWDDDFPHWQSPGIVNVKAEPYGAVGDGVTDDTAAIQRAINDHAAVFLPKGTYAVSQTLRLRPETRLIGAYRCFTWLQPIASPGGDFYDPQNPRPVVQTANNAEAVTTLALLGIRTLENSRAAYCLHWQAGRRSIFRDVNLDLTFRAPPQGLTPPEEAELARLFLQPLVLVDGNGGGRWYNFHQESSKGHGPDYRHLLIRGTRQPMHMYQCNPEHARSDANLEIRDAENVFLYGVKGEYYRPIVRIVGSRRVGVFGYGGNAAATPGDALFVIENSTDFVLVQLVDSPRFPSGQPDTYFAGDGVDPERWHMLVERTAAGEEIRTEPLERPALYKRGNW